MENIIICKDEKTAQELLVKGCKLLKKENGIYSLVNCSNKINFDSYKDRVIFTNRLTF